MPVLANFSLWNNFFFVVLLQLFVYIGVLIVAKTRIRKFWMILIVSALIGLLFGAFYDLVIGSSIDIFSYRINYSWQFFILNSIFSYGLAVATAAAFPPIFAARGRRVSRSVAACLAVAAVAGVVVLAAFATWPILRVFSAGGAILAAGEIAALWLDRRGPIVALFLGQPAYLVRLWIWSAAIGLVYETANHVFPVWIWGLLETHSLPTTELLIVGFGYVVLFHPLVFGWQVVLKRIESSREAV